MERTCPRSNCVLHTHLSNMHSLPFPSFQHLVFSLSMPTSSLVLSFPAAASNTNDGWISFSKPVHWLLLASPGSPVNSRYSCPQFSHGIHTSAMPCHASLEKGNVWGTGTGTRTEMNYGLWYVSLWNWNLSLRAGREGGGVTEREREHSFFVDLFCSYTCTHTPFIPTNFPYHCNIGNIVYSLVYLPGIPGCGSRISYQEGPIVCSDAWMLSNMSSYTYPLPLILA